MQRVFHILIVQAKSDLAFLERLVLLPAWHVETILLDEALGRLQGLAGTDLLIADLYGGNAKDWSSLFHIAENDFEGIPVILLVSDKVQNTGEIGERFGSGMSDRAFPPISIDRRSVLNGETNLQEIIADRLKTAGRVENRSAILVTHGTDTMAWAFAYLRYALSNLNSNIALTGSQLPLEGTFSLSDALGNLRTSVYLLNRLVPGRLFLVFNEGRHIYSGSLNKIRKWDQNAFDGRLAGAVGAEWVDFFDQDWGSIAYADQRLEQLHLYRTGGTIESSAGVYGSLSPGADFVKKYLNESLASQFEKLVDHNELELSRDSSNISLEEWDILACAISGAIGCQCDTRFDSGVKVVYANPFMSEDDYCAQFEACRSGVILAGYGAGNANTLEISRRSVIPAIRQAVSDGKIVVLSSQVPLESYDMDYQVGRELVQAGGIPAGDLSLADAQIKLSYLCGHRKEIETAVHQAGYSNRQALSAAFLAGVKLRKKTSRTWLVETLKAQDCPIKILLNDPFEGQSFNIGLQTVVDGQKELIR